MSNLVTRVHTTTLVIVVRLIFVSSYSSAGVVKALLGLEFSAGVATK